MESNKTPRVRLRALEPDDVEMLYELENDMQTWASTCATAPYSRHALREYIASTQNDVFADAQLRMVVEVDGVAVGCVDLCHVDAKNRHAEVSFGIVRAWRGRGIGGEAVRQLVEYATEMLGLRSLMAMVVVGNEVSVKLLERVGFMCVGTLHGWVNAGDVLIFECLEHRFSRISKD